MRQLQNLKTLISLLLILTTLPASAERSLKEYLDFMDVQISWIQKHADMYDEEIRTEQKKKSVLSMRTLLERHSRLWTADLQNIFASPAPSEAQTYSQAVLLYIQKRGEMSRLRLKNLNDHIALVLKLREMKKNGASPEELGKYRKENALDRSVMNRQYDELKASIQFFKAKVEKERELLQQILDK